MADPAEGTPDAGTEANYRKRRKREPLRIGLLGCGAINSTVAKMIANQQAGPSVLAAILVRRERSEEEVRSMLTDDSSPPIAPPKSQEPSAAAAAVRCTTDADEFFAAGSDWNICIEAAGQAAVREHGKRCLEMGRDLMITSIGALTDETLYRDLRSAAESSGARLVLCTGSMPALDWMGAAALAGCGEVLVTQIKPPGAWVGTPAENDHPDLLSLSEPRVLFEGSSREAASTFPKNANVAAMLALATAGLDATRASLVADPRAGGNRVRLSFRGAAGTIAVEVEAAPSKTNPRTSAIVALSVVKAIRKLCCPVVVGL